MRSWSLYQYRYCRSVYQVVCKIATLGLLFCWINANSISVAIAEDEVTADFNDRISRYFQNAAKFDGDYSYDLEVYFEDSQESEGQKAVTRQNTIASVICSKSIGSMRYDSKIEQFHDSFQVYFESHLVTPSKYLAYRGSGPGFDLLERDRGLPMSQVMLETFYFTNLCLFPLESWSFIRMGNFDTEQETKRCKVLWSEVLDEGRVMFVTAAETNLTVVEYTFARSPDWAPVSLIAKKQLSRKSPADEVSKLTIGDWKPFISVTTEWRDFDRLWIPIRMRNTYDSGSKRKDVNLRSANWRFSDQLEKKRLDPESYNAEQLKDPEFFDELLLKIGEDHSDR